MSLYTDIKLRINECQRSGENHERDTLRTVIGEAQLNASRKGQGSVSDEEIVAILKKSKQNIEQTFLDAERVMGCVLWTDGAQAKLKAEIVFYNKFLPKYLTQEEILYWIDTGTLAPSSYMKVIPDILSAKSDGQATGVAMKYLKARELSVQGQDVSAVVKQFREKQKKWEQENPTVVVVPKEPESGALAAIKMESFPILDKKTIVEPK